MADESMQTTPLTQDRLQKTTSIDKNTSISSFIQSQTRYLSSYAREGKKAITEWDRELGVETEAKQTTESKNEKGRPPKGFSSPILKPRVPAKDSGRQEETHKRSNKENVTDKGKSVRECTATQKFEPRKKAGSPASRKRKAVCPSDDEHAKRLDERKERRRIKKSIVAPKEVHESDKGSDDGSKKSKKRKASSSKEASEDRSKTKKKLPAGLALMHGFNASNVGKQRLTVNSKNLVASNSGVFSKGKASKKSKVDDRKATTKPVFDEAKFLGVSVSAFTRKEDKHQTLKSPVLSVLDDDSATSSEHQSESSSPSKKKFLITNKMPKKKKEQAVVEEVEQTTSSPSVVKSNYESEVWDIERDMEDSIVGHEKSSRAPSASVVVNCKNASWGAQVEQDTIINARSEVGQDVKSPTLLSARHSSLAPSQSASQLPIKAVALNSGMISRFFGHDLKGNADSEQPRQDKDIPAPQTETAPRRIDSPRQHVTVLSEEVLPLETEKRHAELAPSPVNTVSLLCNEDIEEPEVRIPWDEDLNALDQDPLDLLEDLNNGRLLEYSVAWNPDHDAGLSEYDFQEDRNAPRYAATYDAFQPSHDSRDDFPRVIDEFNMRVHDPYPPEGDFSHSLGPCHYANGDPTSIGNHYIDGDFAQSSDALNLHESSGDLPTDVWLGVQASDDSNNVFADSNMADDEYRVGEGYLQNEYLDPEFDSEALTFADPHESSISHTSESFFSQGRALLLGMDFGSNGKGLPRQEDHDELALQVGNISEVEKSVARSLRGHWHPVKF